MLTISLFLYRLTLRLYLAAIYIFAWTGNERVVEWLKGRKGLLVAIRTSFQNTPDCLWFHCASLGEFEQGRTLMSLIRRQRPNAYIVLSFFSPSGYRRQQNYSHADKIIYLPLDSPRHAVAFIEAIHPKAAFFIRYEYWYYYFRELYRKDIPLYMISAVFSPSQPFFKFYGALYRRMLSYVSYFFVQEGNSSNRLSSLGYENFTVIADTRIDRVYEQAKSNISIPSIENFLAGEKCFIGGSIYAAENEWIHQAWKDKILKGKIILVPHQVDKKHIESIRALWQDNALLYSEWLQGRRNGSSALIINTVGLLSALYKYGWMAFVGGGFTGGIHNTLEPAAFGLPIIVGPRHQKFPEVAQMIALGGAVEVNSYAQFKSTLKNGPDGEINHRFIEGHVGGTEIIYQYLLRVGELNISNGNND